jgi:hypothetical protein
MDNLNLADIAAVCKDQDGLGGGNWLAMIFLFALIFGFGGFGGNRAAPAPETAGYARNVLTENEFQNGMNYQSLQNQIGRSSDFSAQAYTGLQNGLCNIGYENLQNAYNITSAINTTGNGLATAIDGVKYAGAMNTAGIIENAQCNTQKILDAIQGNRIADMQNQINMLQIQNAMCGVIRYPSAVTYNAGSFPCNCTTTTAS